MNFGSALRQRERQALGGTLVIQANVQVETIDGAGHWAHHDQLDNFLNLTRTFLAD